jgi:hypothetical protein
MLLCLLWQQCQRLSILAHGGYPHLPVHVLSAAAAAAAAACPQVSLLITMNVLADVLVDDKELKQQLMKQAGELQRSDDALCTPGTGA